MVEGQEGITWPQWRAIAEACEEHGIRTLFRSEHYMNIHERHPERGSLETLGTVIALAAVTTKLRLSTMASPVTFRHPSVMAKLCVTADNVSGGRFELGIGAGWHEGEHRAYGFEFYDLPTRMDILEEQLAILHGSWEPGPFSFSGKHYTLTDLDAQPKPISHIPIILGGRGGPKSVRLAATYADEYNTLFGTPEIVRERKGLVDAACEKAGRQPIPFSIMTPVIVGLDERDLLARAERVAPLRSLDPSEVLRAPPPGWIVGTVDEATETIAALSESGVSRILCQHLPHTDLEFIGLLGDVLAPAVDAAVGG